MDDSIRREQLLATDLKDIGRRLSDAESRVRLLFVLPGTGTMAKLLWLFVLRSRQCASVSVCISISLYLH